jgi:hypothetical protein
VRQPQLPDAVSARVPESVPVEVAAAYPEPALELVTAPVPDTPVMNVMGRPYPAPASHFHVYQPAGYVIFQPGLARGRYLLLNGGYSGYPAPVSSAGLETVGYAPDGRYSRP